ncbi:TetR/AcrR family transcriptional regulator [Nocardiopsis lambiniae]|uniref:TetR/AcrR family transcriptional regulator n=1 Tax=Nocardiopsis lambiniae TaxID=3075539 RepID=A0ABU2MDE9_9ACTN|nr:TetR/AcrR family transcriptional regulator [Nocardiopsis sp. DSM 44743]MDT0330637.1 TetR/AcrR family transcriptional regulator [Nocardiopsis sp. DSM 44743]
MDASTTAEAADDPGEVPPKRTRRRGPELIEAIHEAAIVEAAENGLHRLSMEGIARRAGTAKTSLYRRWAGPADILLEAMYHHFPQERPAPGADDLRGDLIESLVMLAELSDDPLGRAMFAVIAESVREPKLHERFTREVFEPRGGRFTRTVLAHYADRGRIDPSRVTDVTVDIGEAMVLKYAVDHRRTPGRDHLARIVDEVILPAVGAGPEPPRTDDRTR